MTEGTELPVEAELIRQEGVSRSTVREALRILEHEGLVTTRRGGGGAFVTTPDARQTARSLAALLSVSQAHLRDLFEFRRLVEPKQRDWPRCIGPTRLPRGSRGWRSSLSSGRSGSSYRGAAANAVGCLAVSTER